MKYLITESQFDKVIFKYLNNQDFIQIVKGNRIYFVNSDDEYAQIIFNKDDGWCDIHTNLVKEISSYFSLKYYDSEKIIGKWVENTIQMKVKNTALRKRSLMILVENTLQLIFTQKQITL